MEVGQHVGLAGGVQNLFALVAVDLGEDVGGTGYARLAGGPVGSVGGVARAWHGRVLAGGVIAVGRRGGRLRSECACRVRAVSVEITPVSGRRDLKAFIDVPFAVHANHPLWTPPLKLERRLFLSRRMNAFFSHGEAEYLPRLARRAGGGADSNT